MLGFEFELPQGGLFGGVLGGADKDKRNEIEPTEEKQMEPAPALEATSSSDSLV